jgi:hypothetical protein
MNELEAIAREMLNTLEDAKRWIELLPEDIAGGSIMPEKLGDIIARASSVIYR